MNVTMENAGQLAESQVAEVVLNLLVELTPLLPLFSDEAVTKTLEDIHVGIANVLAESFAQGIETNGADSLSVQQIAGRTLVTIVSPLIKAALEEHGLAGKPIKLRLFVVVSADDDQKEFEVHLN